MTKLVNMQYNTELNKLRLPAFGRNFQRMVEHCLTIQDKSERLHCAETIVDIMVRVFPDLADKEDNNLLLWNEVAAMSNYKLDIDYPVEIVPQEDLSHVPNPIDYPEADILYRHYGHIAQELIYRVTKMPDGDEKNDMIVLIAKHMKNAFITWGNNFADNQRIIKDLKAISNNELEFDDAELLECLNDTSSSSGERKLKNKGKRRK